MQHTFLMEFEKKLNFKYYTYLKINKLKKKKVKRREKALNHEQRFPFHDLRQ